MRNARIVLARAVREAASPQALERRSVDGTAAWRATSLSAGLEALSRKDLRYMFLEMRGYVSSRSTRFCRLRSEDEWVSLSAAWAAERVAADKPFYRTKKGPLARGNRPGIRPNQSLRRCSQLNRLS